LCLPCDSQSPRLDKRIESFDNTSTASSFLGGGAATAIATPGVSVVVTFAPSFVGKPRASFGFYTTNTKKKKKKKNDTKQNEKNETRTR
jgi:hypothetical protein